ncbi:hypothetical protein A3J15_03395 [Candidatus Roizmanbacteria bacterium RIFCSPLOWO2_02_FULL_38_10]|uniref:Phospho-N-acetylmuramoyl-pentapeptide-transferase n=1 Tax=Candidatus Roizmanbacteria bacterium RIFCSPLOWO2_02_FULL_38_10 TaxID=1802074 RepID=A0A1F7JN00_9BACT|nr:MAG: hypothetical protein A3J15_03395 [Candidatus Roizmanbacteria bacterium RIFCSPLOWO2_02_FULL_38_10]
MILIIPFINLLYKLKFQRGRQETKDAFDKRTPIFDSFHKLKAGTPVGGGLMLVVTTLVLFLFFTVIFTFLKVPIISNFGQVINEIKIILFTFVFFSFLGLYDDISKILVIQKGSFFGLRMRHKLIIEIALALIVAFWIYKDLKIDFINIPFFGIFHIGWFYIIFAAFVIVAFTNAVNITDGLDGLASGCLAIALTGLWAISISILDTPLSLFLVVWIGGMIALLYFNVYPARLFIGDTGSLAFGATFAVIGLMLGKSFALVIIGGIFMIEIITSFIQLMSKKFRKKKFFPVAPFHLFLQLRGWEEPKIVMRAWVISVMFAIIGLMIAFMK